MTDIQSLQIIKWNGFKLEGLWLFITAAKETSISSILNYVGMLSDLILRYSKIHEYYKT